MTTETNASAATAMKLRLRDDLRAAMAGRRSAEVAVLRTLLGALDQAEAVAAVSRGRELKFGGPATEVPRRRLSVEEVREVVRRERDELRSAADDYAHLQQADAAAGFALKAEILERYLAPA